MAFNSELAERLEKQYGMPEGLLSRMAWQESRDKPTAVSPKGAQGLMQLMPGTAHDMGVANPMDPDQNLEGGAKYLHQMYERFGDWPHALAAYNAGPGKVSKGAEIPGYTKGYVEGAMADGTAAQPKTGNHVIDQMMGDPERQAMVAEINADIKRSDADEADLRKSIAASSKAYEDIQQKIDSIKFPDAPMLPKAPEPPKQAKSNPMGVLQQFLPVVAILGGFKSHAPAIATMKALAAGAEARKKNDEEAFQQAHTEFKDQMEKLQTEWNMSRQAYMDAFENTKASLDQRMNDLRIQALKDGNTQLLHDIDTGDLSKAFQRLQMHDASMYHLGTVYAETQRNELDRQRLKLEQEHNDAMLKYEMAKIPPATQAYNDTYSSTLAQAKKAGKSDDEAHQMATQAAAQTAGEVMQRVRSGAQHELFNEEKAIRESLLKKGGPGEAYQAVRNNEAKIEDAAAHPSLYLTPAGSTVIADTFTRTFNGGNAIRGFQAKMLTDDRTVQNTLKGALQKFQSGGKFTPEEIKQMAEAVKRVEPELKEQWVGAAKDAIGDAKSYGLNPSRIIPYGLRDGLDLSYDPAAGAAATATSQDGWSIAPVG